MKAVIPELLARGFVQSGVRNGAVEVEGVAGRDMINAINRELAVVA